MVHSQILIVLRLKPVNRTVRRAQPTRWKSSAGVMKVVGCQNKVF